MICQHVSSVPQILPLPEPNCNLELILFTPWISIPPFSPLQRPSADPRLRSRTQSCSFPPSAHASSTMPAQPMALCLHNTAKLTRFSHLPSSRSVKCFLLDQRRAKLVNHSPNAAVARQLPRRAMCVLPANCRWNPLLQAQLSIIPAQNTKTQQRGPSRPAPGSPGRKSDTPRTHLLAQCWLGAGAQGGAPSRCPEQFGSLVLQKHGQKARQPHSVMLSCNPLASLALSHHMWPSGFTGSAGSCSGHWCSWWVPALLPKPRDHIISQGTNSTRLCTPLQPKSPSSLSSRLPLNLMGLMIRFRLNFINNFVISLACVRYEEQEILLVYIFGVQLDVQSGWEGT